MEKDSHVAYSYMVRKQSSSQEARQCSGIPSHVRSQVERQEQVKKVANFDTLNERVTLKVFVIFRNV